MVNQCDETVEKCTIEWFGQMKGMEFKWLSEEKRVWVKCCRIVQHCQCHTCCMIWEVTGDLICRSFYLLSLSPSPSLNFSLPSFLPSFFFGDESFFCALITVGEQQLLWRWSKVTHVKRIHRWVEGLSLCHGRESLQQWGLGKELCLEVLRWEKDKKDVCPLSSLCNELWVFGICKM